MPIATMVPVTDSIAAPALDGALVSFVRAERAAEETRGSVAVVMIRRYGRPTLGASVVGRIGIHLEDDSRRQSVQRRAKVSPSM